MSKSLKTVHCNRLLRPNLNLAATIAVLNKNIPTQNLCSNSLSISKHNEVCDKYRVEVGAVEGRLVDNLTSIEHVVLHQYRQVTWWGCLKERKYRPCSQYQSQNAKRASSQKRHMVISIFLLCNSLILMSI